MTNNKKLHELLLDLNMTFRNIVCDMYDAKVPNVTYEMTKTVGVSTSFNMMGSVTISLTSGDLHIICPEEGVPTILPDNKTLTDFIYNHKSLFDADEFSSIISELTKIDDFSKSFYLEYVRMMLEDSSNQRRMPHSILSELNIAYIANKWISVITWLEEYELVGINDDVKYVVKVERDADTGNLLFINDQITLICKPDGSVVTSLNPIKLEDFMKTAFSSVDDDTGWSHVEPLVKGIVSLNKTIWMWM